MVIKQKDHELTYNIFSTFEPILYLLDLHM